jgi:hypothetical protein
MYSDTKITRSVADAVEKIMNPQSVAEELKGGQVKIDKNHNGKIDGQDFKILRGEKKGVVKEDDTGYQDRFAVKNGKAVKHNPEKGEHDEPHHVWADSSEHAVRKHAAMNKPKTEEVESIDEVKMADLPSTKVQGRSYGASKPEPHAVDTLRGPKEKELKDIDAEKKKKKFSEMVNLYQEKGLKSLSEMLKKEEPVVEGASEEQFNAQLDVAKFKANTKDDDTVRPVKKKTTTVAKGEELAINREEVEIIDYPLDVDAINGVSIQEREMTGSEMEKRETIVKSMKKGMAGFKDRYGDRAKNVMYATATKQAMK